jgi:hypothetical protein
VETAILQFALSGAVIAVAGVFLVRFADRIGDLTGTAFGVVLSTSAAVMAQLYRFEQKRKLVDPGAETILFLVVLTLALVHQLGAG